jgi:ribose/xylose/arabinose/galactoside ABC-type transport system permease subunit
MGLSTPRRPTIREGPSSRSLWARRRREISVGIALAALLVLLAVRAPSFFQWANLRDLLVASAPVLVAALGMTMVILARQIDISIGSQFAICGVAAGLLAKAGLPMPLVALGVVVIGGLLGAINGALVAALGLPAIVVTLATMVFWREGLRWATEGAWVQDLPTGFQWFGLGQGRGRVVVVVLAALVFALCAGLLRHLAVGRSVYATGSDPEAARLAGIHPRRVVFGTFVVLGALVGLSALLTSIQFIDVQTQAGVGLELRVIAAVVVGGTTISGGRGSVLGTLLGVALLGAIGPGLSFLGTEAHWERALQGLVILLAVGTDALASARWSRHVRA